MTKKIETKEVEEVEEVYVKYVINVYGGEFTFNFADGSKMIVQQGKPTPPITPPK